MQKTTPRIISPLNVENRSLFVHDNLPVLRSMDSDTVDLIYLDPPFNTGRQWENPIEAKGKKATASFEDTWRTSDIHTDEYYALVSDYPEAAHIIDALEKVNGDSWKAYLVYMGVRLAELHRILKETGSIYFHCDPVMSHGVKLLMDAIFGKKNFRNEVIWHYRRWTAGTKNFQRMHDVILRYTKTEQFGFNLQYEPYGDWIKKDYKYLDETTGKRWRWHTVKGKRYKVYLEDENRGVKVNDVWQIPHLGSTAKERTGYPTQKPLSLLERIIKASSNEGDVVLDPFCGCATTCVAAEMLKRQWIGIDLSENAADIIYQRLHDIVDSPLANPKAAVTKVTVKNQYDLPKRTDLPKYDRDKTRTRLLKLYGNKCACCQEEFKNDRILENDHIIAKSRGGQDVEENIQLLCPPCNQDKGGGSMEAARRKTQERLMREKMEAAREDWWKEREVVYKSANKK